MKTTVKEVNTRAELKKFIHFPLDLYKDSEYFVPALEGDEFDNFNPKRNGAYEFCKAQPYLAYNEKGEIVGRVAAIINNKSNELWSQKVVRFGWFDFIEDKEVAKALLDTVAQFGKDNGCTEIKGPLGFTDLDKEGLLVEGFDKLSPFTCLYNYPYYDTILKELGFEKDVDWTQRIIYLENVIQMENFNPEDPRVKASGIHLAKPRTTLGLCLKYGMSIFHMYNETFAPLYEFSPITDKQIRTYLVTYVPIMSKKFVSVVLDRNDNPIGFSFCVPSLSRAVKASNGKLLPTGIFRILRALRKNEEMEALMIGVLPEYQKSYAVLIMFKEVYDNCKKFGIKKIMLNPQLENNIKVQSIFNHFKAEPFLRRRAYTKSL